MGNADDSVVSPMEHVHKRRAGRRQLNQGGLPFNVNTLSDAARELGGGTGVFTPTNCITEEIAGAIDAGIEFLKTYGIEVNINGLHGCESQVSEKKNFYLEVSV